MITKNTLLKEIIKLGEPCKKCGHCCQYGSGVLADDDLEKIAKFLRIDKEELKKEYMEEIEKFNIKKLRPKLIRKDMPYGRCVFFEKEAGCKIHEVKPLQCKINNCSDVGEELTLWFMLNYFVNKNDPESIRQFATYLKTGGKTLPGGELKDFIADEKRLKKILDYDDMKIEYFQSSEKKDV
ncbi:MAG: YkgJ family cysteine cluster protein [Nanoarchaeota archaeon]